MKDWSGIERVFRLSLGVQVGANALALLAALEFKRSLQKDLMDTAEYSSQPISISSEEWRSIAGIFERKAYDRAKAKLEESGVIHIQREGRVLQVTLWPNLMKDDLNEGQEATFGTLPMTANETIDETTDETVGETTHKAEPGTSYRIAGAIIPEKEEHLKPIPSLSIYPGGSNIERSPLNRTSLPLSSLTRNLLSNQDNHSIRNNNEQRKNEQRNNEIRIRDDPKDSNKTTASSLLNPNRLSKEDDIGPTFKHLWQSEIGHALTRYEEEGLERFLRLGYTEEILVEALRCAVLADRRHMGYLLGTLRNWYRAGVRHFRDITHVQKSWEDKRFLERATAQV